MGLSKTQTGIVFCGDHSLDRTVDYLVSFEDGQFSDRYPAPFSTYQKLRATGRSTEKVGTDHKPVKPAGDKNRERSRSRKLTWSEQQELVQLETKIELLETEQPDQPER